MEPPGQGSSPSPINARVLVAGGCGPSAGLAVARGKPMGDLSSPWRRGRAGEGRLEGRLLLTEPPVALERLGNLGGGGEREEAALLSRTSHAHTDTRTLPTINAESCGVEAQPPGAGGNLQGSGAVPGPGRPEGFGPGPAARAPPWPRGRRPRRSSCPCRPAPGRAAAHSCA